MILPLFVVNAQIREWCSTPADPNCCVVDGVPTLKCLEVVFGNILFMSSALIIIVLFIMLVTGALKYLTSLGNAESIKKARGTITYALIGFALFISAYLILKTIDVLFLGNNNNIFRFQIGGP